LPSPSLLYLPYPEAATAAMRIAPTNTMRVKRTIFEYECLVWILVFIYHFDDNAKSEKARNRWLF
jgi:hypothetical protein